MESINIVMLLSRWLHLIGAIMLLGGSIFVMFALHPGMKVLDDEARGKLRQSIRTRWGRFVHAGIGLLLLTGSLNFYMLGLPPNVKPMPYHTIFGIKFLLALAVFIFATALMGRSPAFEKIRLHSAKWLRIVVILGVTIVLLSGLLIQIRESQINL